MAPNSREEKTVKDKKKTTTTTLKNQNKTQKQEKQALLHRFYWESFNMAEFIGKFI